MEFSVVPDTNNLIVNIELTKIKMNCRTEPEAA
jgi:hypothetical protein